MIESSIAMGLVGIAVFASVSTFGGDIKGKIARELLPALGGGIVSDPNSSKLASSDSLPQPNALSDLSQIGGGYTGPEDSNSVVGGGLGQDEGVGGIAGDPNGQGSSVDNTDNPSFVAGTDAMPPVISEGTDGNSSSASSLWNDGNSFVGGTNASPPVNDESGFSQSSSAVADPSNTLQ